MITILVSTPAIRVPTVVTVSATHLYCVFFHPSQIEREEVRKGMGSENLYPVSALALRKGEISVLNELMRIDLGSSCENQLAERDDENESVEDEEIDSRSEYPETVEFSGIGYTPLLQVHISAALIILVGVIVAVVAPPAGLILLLVFLVFVLLIEAWMFRRSPKKLRLTLHLRQNPVEAFQGDYKVGSIEHGSIEPEMENPNQLGYRPAPKKDLIVWTFDSENDKRIVEKRLLEYLSRDSFNRQAG